MIPLSYPTGHTEGVVNVSLMCACVRQRTSQQTTEREREAFGSEPSGCLHHVTRISVSAVCFTSLLINWNAVPLPPHPLPAPLRNRAWHRAQVPHCAQLVDTLRISGVTHVTLRVDAAENIKCVSRC